MILLILKHERFAPGDGNLRMLGLLTTPNLRLFTLEDGLILRTAGSILETAPYFTSEKVAGKTAIPAGQYRVVLSWSARFQMYLPELLEVPGFTAIRSHAGNTEADTEGCVLVGSGVAAGRLTGSRTAVARLVREIAAVHKYERVYWDVTNPKGA